MLAATTGVKAQDSSLFAQGYRALRDFVATSKSLQLYYIPYGTKRKVNFGYARDKFDRVYHFLRTLPSGTKDADCIIGIFVEQITMHPMAVMAKSAGVVGSSEAFRIDLPYTWSVSLLVYAQGKAIKVPLCVNEQGTHSRRFSSYHSREARIDTSRNAIGAGSFMPTLERELARIRSTEPQALVPPNNEMQDFVIQLLLRLENRYVDRVHW